MRLLVVEDEENVAAYLQQGLEESGYAVDVAFDGAEAIEWAAVVDYDIIILDVMLPEIDGLEACRRMRSAGVSSPILMLTARDTVENRVEGLDAGADDYLIKPFAFPELVARLRALGRRASVEPENVVLTVGELSLDTTTHQAERSGTPIELTAKEYSVLAYLMRNANQVLSRDMIAERVWNYEREHRSNIVDVYIRNLRRKVDDAYEEKLIQTVRGAGYRISTGRN